MNLALWLFIVISSSAYLAYIVLKYGVQSSISSSVHQLESSVKKSLYSWFIACVALPMMILSDNWMGVVAGMFLLFDFAATAGGDKIQVFIHTLGAQGGMFLGAAMLGFMFGQWWLVGLTIVAVLLIHFLKVKHATWWLECAVLWGVLIGLFIEKILI